MNVVGLTDIGLVREKNQDSIYSSNESDFPIFIIADGMGGHKAGEIASKDAINIIKNVFLKHREKLINKKNIFEVIEESIRIANETIYEKSLNLIEYKGMGTTISLCYIYKSHIYIGHVGDSRIYKIKDHGIKQVTEDHSLINELIKTGKISEEEAKHHPQKNVIMRAVGTSKEIEIDISEVKFKKGEKLLLCSDGLSNMLSEEEMLGILKMNSSLENIGEKLINMAKENGGYDNVSLILIEF